MAPAYVRPAATRGRMSRAVALALDLGGTKAEGALVDEFGAIVPGTRHRLPTGPLSTSDDLVTALLSVTQRALADLPPDATLIGIGIGSAGPITVATGSVSPLNLPV